MIFYRNSILIIFLSIPALINAQKIQSVEEWEQRFLKSWDKEYTIAKKQSTSKDSWKFYNLAYYIDGNITMFQASGKPKYLDRAIEYVQDMMNSAQKSSKLKNSQFNDGYMSWVNLSNKRLGANGKEYPLFESFCWRYVTTLLREICENGQLLSSLKYQKFYEKTLAFTEKHIYEKWERRGKKHLYRSNTHMRSHWARIAMDLFLITENDKYKKVVDDFVKRMKDQVEYKQFNEVEVVSWQARWDKKTGIHQDVSHGNAVVSAIIELYENNMGFDKRIIDAMVHTFDKAIWKTKNNFANRFDGTEKGSGWFSDGLIKLGRYDVALQKRLEKHNKGRTTQFFGNGALNAKRLLNNHNDQ